MRKLNRDTLKVWSSGFKNESTAISTLVVKTGIGFFTLRRIFQGKREPSMSEQLALLQATELSNDDLFPIFDEKKKTA